MSQRKRCDKYLTVCNLFWLGPVINEELAEEIAHDRVLPQWLFFRFSWFFAGYAIIMFIIFNFPSFAK